MTTKKASERGGAATLSLLGAFLILGLKFGAYAVTGSVGLLSDAAESLVNLVAAVALIIAIGVASTPPDYRHPYGHAKAEYISSVLEAALIIVAAVVIGVSAVRRLLDPQPLEQVGLGLALAGAALVLNGLLALRLFRVAKVTDSAALEANATHLLTDVWTSVGTMAGVGLVRLTGWLPLDPLVALAVAVNIVFAGVRVMRSSFSRLLDERLPESEEERIMSEIDAVDRVLGFHRLKTRRSGVARFAEVDVFVDGDMRVDEAHEVAREVERRVRSAVEDLEMTVHVEPYEEGVRDVTRSPREEYPPES
ncbi:MAG TPA: cation diffusion facilitator family transporter [Trueperaceae bacterium]